MTIICLSKQCMSKHDKKGKASIVCSILLLLTKLTFPASFGKCVVMNLPSLKDVR